MNMHIIIQDTNGNELGELLTASTQDILTYLEKGLIVIDKNTGSRLDKDGVLSMTGVSECVIG